MKSRKHSHGFVMIEALVTALLLAIRVAGMITDQVAASRNQSNAYLVSQAAMFTEELRELVLSNSGQASLHRFQFYWTSKGRHSQVDPDIMAIVGWFEGIFSGWDPIFSSECDPGALTCLIQVSWLAIRQPEQDTSLPALREQFVTTVGI